MMKHLYKSTLLAASLALAFSLAPHDAHAQTPKKIRDLTPASSLAGTDIFEVTVDPSGTPASRKATIAQVGAALGIGGVTEALTAVVDANGNDGTGQVGNPDKPYLTIQAALDDLLAAPATYEMRTLRVRTLAATESVTMQENTGYLFLDLQPGYSNMGNFSELTVTWDAGGSHSVNLYLRGEMGSLTAPGQYVNLVGVEQAKLQNIVITDGSLAESNAGGSLQAAGPLLLAGNIFGYGAAGDMSTPGVPGKSVNLGNDVKWTGGGNSIQLGGGSDGGAGGGTAGTVTISGNAAVGGQNGNMFSISNLDWNTDAKTGIVQYNRTSTDTLTATSTQLGSYVELPMPGVYLLFGHVNVQFAGATFATSRTMTFKYRRINNTAADVSSPALTLPTQITSAQTRSLGSCMMPLGIYVTPRSGDRIAIFGDVSVVPTAGNAEVTGLSITSFKAS